MKSQILDIMKRHIDKLDMSGYEKSTFEKILNCRSEPVPHIYSRCDSCGEIHPVYKSCKNRMCPVCNGAGKVKWIAERESELLPVSYFLLTYTIPAMLRPLFLANTKCCYDLLFKAVSISLIKGIETNNRTFNGKAGFFAVLHTWDQRLNFHPHLHVVIPSGCLGKDSTSWNPSPKNFLLPVRKLSAEFREKLLFYLRKEERARSLIIPEEIDDIKQLLNELGNIPWVVHSQAPGKGKNKPERILRYLSRYVNKAAVSDKRIKKVENGNVYLNYTDRKKRICKTENIPELLFLKRLLFHILPKGFKKIRFYGFMANRYRKNRLVLCRMLLGVPLADQENTGGFIPDTAFLFHKYFGVDITLCSRCGKGHLVYVRGDFEGG